MTTANIITLNEAKAHLRVTDTSEDTMIGIYIEAAVEQVRNFLNVTIITGEGDSPAAVPYSIKAAVLLIIGGLFENRENIITGQTVADNPAVMNLLYPHRVDIGI